MSWYFRRYKIWRSIDIFTMRVALKIVKRYKNSYTMRSWTTIDNTYIGTLRAGKPTEKSCQGTSLQYIVFT